MCAVVAVYVVPFSYASHWYDYVEVDAYTDWNTAATLAQAQTWKGQQGHAHEHTQRARRRDAHVHVNADTDVAPCAAPRRCPRVRVGYLAIISDAAENDAITNNVYISSATRNTLYIGASVTHRMTNMRTRKKHR